MIDISDYELVLNNETGNEKRNCVERSSSGLTGGNNVKLGGTEKSRKFSTSITVVRTQIGSKPLLNTS
jgi:hypothetical protein